MCKTHDYLVHVAEDCLGIHGQSKGTNVIFKKTDDVEAIVRIHAKSVYDFNVSLNETMSRMPPPPPRLPDPEPEPPSKIMKLIRYYDKAKVGAPIVGGNNSPRDVSPRDSLSPNEGSAELRDFLLERGRRLGGSSRTASRTSLNSGVDSTSQD